MSRPESLTYARAVALEPGQSLKCPVHRGLELHAKKTAKVWLLYYRAPDGRQRRPKIGEFPGMKIEDARAVAADYKRRVALGEDPSAERKALRAAPTVAEAWADWIEDYAKPELGADTVKGYESYWRVHICPAVGKMKVAAVKTADINSLTEKAAETTKVTPNRLRAVLFGFFTWTEHPERAYRTPNSNPCIGSKHRREPRRRRHIRLAEFQAIGEALRAHAKKEPRHVAAILCILLCGSRVTELAKAETVELDLDVGAIFKGKHKTQRFTDDDRVIWLPRQALEIIRGLPDDHSGLIFGEGIDRYSLYRVWCAVREAAGCPDLRLQDLRRTFASIAKSRGVSIDEVGELLGHRQAETTKRYAWLVEERAQSATQDLADGLSARLALPHSGSVARRASAPSEPRLPVGGLYRLRQRS